MYSHYQWRGTLMPVTDSIGSQVLLMLLGLIWLLHVVTVCGSAWAVWPMVYVMVCMHALWLQVCGAVNDKSTNSYTTRGTIAYSFKLLTLRSTTRY